MTEKEFQSSVIELARFLGYRVAHFRPAQTVHGWRTPVQGDGKGYPDLTLVRGERLLFVELKGEKGKVSVEQQDWLDALKGTGVEVYLWRPSDWDTIATTLGRARNA